MWFLNGSIYGLKKTDGGKTEGKYEMPNLKKVLATLGTSFALKKMLPSSFHLYCFVATTLIFFYDYLHQVVKESCIEGFGQGVPSVGGLLLVKGHVNGLRLPSPF